MVFLPGEVVIDYQRRLKSEFDADALVDERLRQRRAVLHPVAAHSHRRRLRSGRFALVLRSTRAAGDEQRRSNHQSCSRFTAEKICRENRSGRKHRSRLSPQQALNSMRVAPEFIVDLVAAEPLVVDPVAIDWGADGKLWVVEMRDYPMGMDGKLEARRSVRFLQDTNGDGHYDTATLFLDNLPFPTGVFAWRKGVLVCAAPDILYAEDTNGDGQADVVKKTFHRLRHQQLPGAREQSCRSASTIGFTARTDCWAEEFVSSERRAPRVPFQMGIRGTRLSRGNWIFADAIFA